MGIDKQRVHQEHVGHQGEHQIEKGEDPHPHKVLGGPREGLVGEIAGGDGGVGGVGGEGEAGGVVRVRGSNIESEVVACNGVTALTWTVVCCQGERDYG